MKRRALWLHILLLIVTFGIYAIVWTTQLSKHLKQHNIGFAIDSWRHVLCWMFTFNFYNIIWCYDAGRYLASQHMPDRKWLYFGLKFIPIIGTLVVLIMMQVSINAHYGSQPNNDADCQLQTA